MSSGIFQLCRGASLGLLLALAGCDQLIDKASKDDAAKAEKKVTSGDFRGAVSSYEAALDGTPHTAEVHYSLALIYMDKLKEPRDALHHLDRYLELEPKGLHAKDAAAMQKEAALRMAMGQGKGTFVTQSEAVRIRNENLELRKTLAELRAQKSTPTPSTTAKASSKNEVATKPIPPGTRVHVVQPGETMGSIAQKYYKNKARWKDIQDANFYSTSGTAKIKVGQSLIIP